MTNAEKIRSMSYEELAEFLGSNDHCKCCDFDFLDEDCCVSTSCGEGVKIWLKKEVQGE